MEERYIYNSQEDKIASSHGNLGISKDIMYGRATDTLPLELVSCSSSLLHLTDGQVNLAPTDRSHCLEKAMTTRTRPHLHVTC